MRTLTTTLLLGAALATGIALAAPGGDINKAIDLPVQADALRKAGVPDADVKEAVRSAESHGLSAAEADEVLEEGDKARKKNGKIDNFGGFVNDRLDEGLRGKDLAAAIHAEHEKRGKGKGKGKGKSADKAKGPKDGKGKPADKAKGPKDGKGKPDDKGKPADKGGKGKGGDKGKPSDKGGKGKGKNK